MITPRQKAIVVGSLLGNASIEKRSDGYHYVAAPVGQSRHYDTWRRGELTGVIRGSDEREGVQKFLEKGWQLAQEGRLREEWLWKMSPLAVASWYMDCASSLTELPAWRFSNTDIEIIKRFFREKSSIRLAKKHTSEVLSPSNEESLINLWLLVKEHVTLGGPHLIPELEAQYPRKNQTIYLSGGMEKAKGNGIGWRGDITPCLFRAGYDLFNPVFIEKWADKFGINLQQLKEEDYVAYMRAGAAMIKQDMPAVADSDLVLVYWDEAAVKGAGTKAEATYAHMKGLPIVLWLGDGFEVSDIPLWTAGCVGDPEHFVSSQPDAVTLIKRVLSEEASIRVLLGT